MIVASSAFRRVTYNCATHELTVVFNDGTAYRYSALPKYVYEDLLCAKSKGRFFNTDIRNNYKCRKISTQFLS